jgi:predicted ATPase
MLRWVNPATGPVSGGLVGRGRELARLVSWLDRARAGVGRLVLCAGEPGIG